MWGGLLIMIIAMIMARIIMVTIGRIGDKGESILCLCADGKIREGSGRAPNIRIPHRFSFTIIIIIVFL